MATGAVDRPEIAGAAGLAAVDRAVEVGLVTAGFFTWAETVPATKTAEVTPASVHWLNFMRTKKRGKDTKVSLLIKREQIAEKFGKPGL